MKYPVEAPTGNPLHTVMGPVSGPACAIALILRRLALALERGAITREMLGLDSVRIVDAIEPMTAQMRHAAGPDGAE